jgi:hypothetical protein
MKLSLMNKIELVGFFLGSAIAVWNQNNIVVVILYGFALSIVFGVICSTVIDFDEIKSVFLDEVNKKP